MNDEKSVQVAIIEQIYVTTPQKPLGHGSMRGQRTRERTAVAPEGVVGGKV
jgi:hypothetical protein